MKNLQERLQQILQANGGVNKQASAADSTLVDNAEMSPAPEASVSNPADAQTGAAAECITDNVGAEGLEQPGTNSELGDGPVPSSPAGGIDASNIEGNQKGEAEQVLDIKKDEVSKEESIDVINKAANAVRAVAARIQGLPVEDLDAELNKQASDMDPKELLIKAANAGDATAQAMVDWLCSYELGVSKKANDIAELTESGMTPEQVAETEDMLNMQALESPEILMAEEDIDPEVLKAVAEVGAEIEAAAQEATAQVSEAIRAEDPSISAEEANLAAQEVVADALLAADAQQALGAQDEAGEYVIDDATAAQVVDELDKTASANPLRSAVIEQFNNHFGLTSDAFNRRMGR